jgi:predicted phage terminase large subunit-like protein
VKDKKFYVLDVPRKKLRFAELTEAVRLQRTLYDADIVVIEDAPAGTHLIQHLRDQYLPIEAQRPIGDKFTRLSAVIGYIESGLVMVPEEAEWLGDFLAEITRFPNVRNDDQVDAFIQTMAAAIESARQPIWVM